MPVTSDASAPYAPAKAVLEIVSRYRAKGLPQPINEEVLERVGITESLRARTLQALQTLDLIDDKGAVTATFESLRLAPENEYKERIAQWLNAAYADVLRFIDPHTSDETTIQDAFRAYNPPGQRDRMVTLFIGLYAAAGIGSEKASSRSTRKPRVAKTANGSAKTPPISAGRSLVPVVQPPVVLQKSPTLTPETLSDKALEYKLVDLMKNADIKEEQRTAIWTLIQYLTARAKSESILAEL